ncbi:MBG domain-containing protein, partial [Pedobacter sp. PLR]|uniref:MBG domain-containing protein n=1 Tax=Pedobacter sp. PLR TaxID=2994465 RepID=UPI002247A1AA
PVIRLLQILPKPVTVTATAQGKVFGDAEPTLAAPAISPALTGTDVSTGTLNRVAGENAGAYEIQQNTFNLDPYKYAITYVPANFTVSKKPVTITPRLAYSKTYGATDPTFEYNFTPLVSTDVITGALA